VEAILASVAVVVVVIVVVVKIILTLVVVAVGRGGDSLDTSSNGGSSSVSREISCSESGLWTTNCPLVLAYSGLEDGGHFPWSLYTFRIQSVFLLFIKYTHDYPHRAQNMIPWSLVQPQRDNVTVTPTCSDTVTIRLLSSSNNVTLCQLCD
jgi:hypothetical protein